MITTPGARSRWVAALALCLVTLAACGDGDVATTAPTAAPTVTDAPSTPDATQTPTDDADDTDATGAAPAVFAYAMPDGALDLGFVTQPTRLEAVVAIPQNGPGPFPVAVVLHGAGPVCTTGVSDADLDGLVVAPWSPPCTREDSVYVRSAFAGTATVAALGRQGIAAISIDANAAYNWWGGEVPEGRVLAALIALHLDAFEDIANGTTPTDDVRQPVELDLDRIALVGHSRGGGFAEAQFSPPDEQQDRLPVTPTAIVLLGSAGHYSTPDRGVPTLNVRSSCDEDVGAHAGLASTEAIASAGGTPVVDVTINGASHWSLTSIPFRAGEVNCAERLDAPRRAELQVAELAAAFLDAVFRGVPVVLPIDASFATVDVLSGEATTSPLVGATSPRPPELISTNLDVRLLPAINPDDRFVNEEQSEDF